MNPTPQQIHTHLSIVQIVSLVMAVLSGVATGLQALPPSIAWAGPVATIVFGLVAALTGWVKAYNVPAAMLIIGLFLFAMGGCSNQAAQLQPQIAAADAAAVTGNTLLSTGGMSLPTAKKLSADLHVADTGFNAAIASIQSGGTPTATTTSEILAALGNIATDLQSTPAAAKVAVRIRAKLKAVKGKDSLSSSDVIALIDLAIQLEPVAVQEIDYLFGGTVPTLADCQAALTQFEAQLTTFDASIATASLSAN